MRDENRCPTRPPTADRMVCRRSFDTPFSKPTSSCPETAGAWASAGAAATAPATIASAAAAARLTSSDGLRRLRLGCRRHPGNRLVVEVPRALDADVREDLVEPARQVER